jgi:hypothetical protein
LLREQQLVVILAVGLSPDSHRPRIAPPPPLDADAADDGAVVGASVNHVLFLLLLFFPLLILLPILVIFPVLRSDVVVVCRTTRPEVQLQPS